MNSTQTQTTAMPMIAFLAGLLAGKGIFGFDAATWTIILASVAGTISVIWSAIVTRKTAMVSSVAAMPEVKQVTLDPTVPTSAAIDSATPNNVVVK